MKYVFFASCVIGLWCVEIFSQEISEPQKAPAAVQDRSAATEDYIVGPEDVLEISVWHEPDLTTKAVVRPDGKIGIPLLNDVQATGLVTKQLQEQITHGLAQFVADPHVSVIVVEIHSQVVHIIGNVARPGAYPLGGPLTVVELLARAGGLADFAKKEEIGIVRSEGGKSRRFVFNYKAFIEAKNFLQNIPLRSGDVVIVP